MSTGTGGIGAGGPDGLVDRRLTEHRDEIARLRAALGDPRRAEPARAAATEPAPSPPTDADEPTPAPARALADRLRADAARAARLLIDLERQVAALTAGAGGVRVGQAEGADELRRARAEALDLRSQRDRAVAEAAALRAEVERLSLAAPVVAPGRPEVDRLPVLARDLARWAAPDPGATQSAPEPPPVAVAVPIGPPPLPPSLDDLAAVDRVIETVRRLVHTPHPDGKPFHTLFDDQRYHALRAKLREANLLADRFLRDVDRSRENKELLWHLMVARRSDELHRKRR